MRVKQKVNVRTEPVSARSRLDFRRLPCPVFHPPRKEMEWGRVRAHFPEQRLVIEPRRDQELGFDD